MTWNLTDTLNTDLNSGGLFDGLPETSQKLAAQAKVPSTQEIAPPPSFDSGRVISRPAQLNGSTDIGQSEVLAPPKDVASLGKSEGVFDSIPTVNERVISPFKESDLPAKVSVPANGRVNGTQRELTLGESFQKAKGVLQQMDAYHKAHNYGSARDRGINTAQYEAAKNHVMSQLGDFLENTYGIAKTDVAPLFISITKTASGFRTAKEIDEIHDIVKNGAIYTNLQGEEVSLPRNSNWGHAITAYDDRFTANIHRKPEKPVKDETVDELAKLNTARAALAPLPDSAGKRAQEEVFDAQEDLLTGGRANYNRHVDRENTVVTAVASSNDRNLNKMLTEKDLAKSPLTREQLGWDAIPEPQPADQNTQVVSTNSKGEIVDQKSSYSTASVSVPHTSLNREKTMEDIQWNLGGWVLGILIGIWVFKRVKPKTKSTTCSEMAKRWLAWGLMGSISTGTSYFFRKGGIEGVAGGLIGVIGFTSIAWVLGLVWGLMKFNLFSKTKPSPRLTAESVKQIQDQAMSGDGKAQFELGSLLYYGESLIKNQVEAYKWILLAQAQGITTSKKLCLEMERKLSRPEMAAGQGLASSFIVNDALPHMKASVNETVKKEEKTPPQLPNSQTE